MMDTEEQIEAVEILKVCLPLLQRMHDEAETRHDSYGSSTYMDSGEFELMAGIESLVERANRIVDGFSVTR